MSKNNDWQQKNGGTNVVIATIKIGVFTPGEGVSVNLSERKLWYSILHYIIYNLIDLRTVLWPWLPDHSYC